jgi:hypothetical protein
MVLMSIGKTLPTNIMKMADSKPTPNHKMAKGIQAIGGIGLRIPINKLERSCAVLDHPIKIPRGMPTTAETSKPDITRNNVKEVSAISCPLIRRDLNDSKTSEGLGKK